VRTTLDIADDVLLAAKELARRERKTAGQVLSDLARRGLRAPAGPAGSAEGPSEELLGFKPFPSRGGVVTNELIDRLREEED
jgi:hypothetical protein